MTSAYFTQRGRNNSWGAPVHACDYRSSMTLLAFANIRFQGLQSGQLVAKLDSSGQSKWKAMLETMEGQEIPLCRSQCAPMAAVMSLLVLEDAVTWPIHSNTIGSCADLSELLTTAAKRRIDLLLSEYLKLQALADRVAARAATAQAIGGQYSLWLANVALWMPTLREGKECVSQAAFRIKQWSYRCAKLNEFGRSVAARAPVVWSCEWPFVGTTRGRLDQDLEFQDHPLKDNAMSSKLGCSTNVCVLGVSSSQKNYAHVFGHFIRGYLFEVLGALARRFGAQAKDFAKLCLSLGSPFHACDVRHQWEEFFLAFLDAAPTVDPGCQLSRLRGDPVLGIRSSPGHHGDAIGAELRPKLRALVASRILRSNTRRMFKRPLLVVLHRRISALTRTTREPLNRKGLRAAVTFACARLHFACRPNIILEDLAWRHQVTLALRTRGLIGIHSSGLMAQALWLPRGATVLDFMPTGCWLCASMNVFRQNTTADAHVTWVLSTTIGTPVARPLGGAEATAEQESNLVGCSGHEGAGFAEFKRRLDTPRMLGFHRSLQAFSIALQGPSSWQHGGVTGIRRWSARLGLQAQVVLDVCGGTAVQVYESAPGNRSFNADALEL